MIPADDPNMPECARCRRPLVHQPQGHLIDSDLLCMTCIRTLATPAWRKEKRARFLTIEPSDVGKTLLMRVDPPITIRISDVLGVVQASDVGKRVCPVRAPNEPSRIVYQVESTEQRDRRLQAQEQTQTGSKP